MSGLSRREALGRIGAGTLALLCGLRTVRAAGPLGAAEPPRIALARNGEPGALARAAIDALGGMGRFVPRGSRVVLKPNIGWDRAPEQGACTHPDIVAALVELSFAAGAREVRVMDNPCNDARRCYTHSGIGAAAEKAKANVIHLPVGRGVETQVGGELVGAWPIFREILEADVLINVPIAKQHSLTGASLGMKNWLGAVDGNRSQLHQNIPVTSVDLAAFFKPCLTVMDATRVLLRNGPQGGNLEDVSHPRAIMAGVDPVAIDAYGASLLGLGPDELPHLGIAVERGLGQLPWDTPELARVDLGA